MSFGSPIIAITRPHPENSDCLPGDLVQPFGATHGANQTLSYNLRGLFEVDDTLFPRYLLSFVHLTRLSSVVLIPRLSPPTESGWLDYFILMAT